MSNKTKNKAGTGEARPFEALVSGMADAHAKDIDEAIFNALPEGMSLDEIKERCRWVCTIHNPDVKTFYLDDDKLFTLQPPKMETVSEGEGLKVAMKQNIEYH